MGKQQEKEQLCPMRGCWAGADSAMAAVQGLCSGFTVIGKCSCGKQARQGHGRGQGWAGRLCTPSTLLLAQSAAAQGLTITQISKPIPPPWAGGSSDPRVVS